MTTPVFLPAEPHGQKGVGWATVRWIAESVMTEDTSMHNLYSRAKEASVAGIFDSG